MENDNDNWKLQSIALDLIASEGRHKGVDIAKLFFKTVKFFEIENKIQGITVDNASANTTFMKELDILMKKEGVEFNSQDQNFRCFAHILNLEVKDVLKLINSPTNEDAKLTIDESITDEYAETDNYLDSDEEALEVEDNFAHIIIKIRNISKKIRHSEVLTNRLNSFCKAANIPFVKPILDVVTRWNSTFDMLASNLQT